VYVLVSPTPEEDNAFLEETVLPDESWYDVVFPDRTNLYPDFKVPEEDLEEDEELPLP
jgi:hypothetical protein